MSTMPTSFMESYYNLQRLTEMPSGGHFHPMEEPERLVVRIENGPVRPEQDDAFLERREDGLAGGLFLLHARQPANGVLAEVVEYSGPEGPRLLASLRFSLIPGAPDDDASKSWNTSHPSRACDAASLVATGGAGLLYCFAID